jgi:hypothetical protein
MLLNLLQPGVSVAFLMSARELQPTSMMTARVPTLALMLLTLVSTPLIQSSRAVSHMRNPNVNTR